MLNYEKRQTQKRTLVRKNDTNGFKPAHTRPYTARYSAAPTANYYSAINWTIWPIYGPGTGYLSTVLNPLLDCHQLFLSSIWH